jgi:hypothetical protein
MYIPQLKIFIAKKCKPSSELSASLALMLMAAD